MRGKDRTLEENRDGRRRRVFLHVILMCSSQGEPGIQGWAGGHHLGRKTEEERE